MTGGHLRTDPLTGMSTWHAPASRRVTQVIDRTPPDAPAGPCFLCPGGSADEPAVLQAGAARVIPNAYPVLGDGTGSEPTGVNELVHGPSHALSISDVSVEEAADVLAAAHARAAEHARAWAHAGAFMQVGRYAGATAPHLHVQVLASVHLPGSPADRYAQMRADTAAGLRPCLLCADRERARSLGLGLTADAWVPEAPSVSREVRVAGTCGEPGTWGDLATGVRGIAAAWDATGTPWAYNLVMHLQPHPWIAMLPRTTHGTGYAHLLGVNLVLGDVNAYARQLVEALP
jgi:hypothetical protein